MHPRDSASREIRHRRPMEIPPLKTTAKEPVAEYRRPVFYRLRTALKVRHKLRLPWPPFLGGMQMRNYIALRGHLGYSLTNGSAATAPHTVQKQGRFYLLAEPFRCPTIGEPLNLLTMLLACEGSSTP